MSTTRPATEWVVVSVHASPAEVTGMSTTRPATETAVSRNYDSLGGEPLPRPSRLIYKCPECDYTDAIPQQGMTPEPCPKHPTAVLQASDLPF